MSIRIKPQFIGGVLNLPNLADQSVAKLKSLHCWHLYSSGKASIGRKSSLQAIRRILVGHGMEKSASDFLSAVIERMRMEQRAEETLVGQFSKCAVCGGDGKIMTATNDPWHPLQARDCPECK